MAGAAVVVRAARGLRGPLAGVDAAAVCAICGLLRCAPFPEFLTKQDGVPRNGRIFDTIFGKSVGKSHEIREDF